MAQCIVGYCSK